MANGLARGSAIWFTWVCAALAEADPQVEIHLWTDASGRFSVQAEFVRAECGDYATERQTEAFHRWTEVWFPKVGWVFVDVTLIDSASLDSYDDEFLFGLPGYSIVLSRGGIDEKVLGLGYHINRLYQGGKRERKTYVVVEPSVGNDDLPIVTLR